jgi:hypothetical protein
MIPAQKDELAAGCYSKASMMPPLLMILGSLTLLSGAAMVIMLLRRKITLRNAVKGRGANDQTQAAMAQIEATSATRQGDPVNEFADGEVWPAPPPAPAESKDEMAYLAPPMTSGLDYLEILAQRVAKDEEPDNEPGHSDAADALFENADAACFDAGTTKSKICPRCGSRYSYRYSVCSHDSAELSVLN